MKTYWDLSEKERAQLSREEVERYLDAELMTKGVLKVEPPEYEPEPDVALPEGQLFHRPIVDSKQYGFRNADHIGIAFETQEQCEAFLKLRPFKVDSEYFSGHYSSQVHTAKAIVLRGGEHMAESVRLVPHDTMEASRAEYERLAAAQKCNEEKRRQFEKEAKEQKDALQGLWDDWYRCGRLHNEHQRVVDTFEQYTRTADGDTRVAARFLAKVFSADQIKEAAEWCGVTIPDPNAPQVEAAQ